MTQRILLVCIIGFLAIGCGGAKKAGKSNRKTSSTRVTKTKKSNERKLKTTEETLDNGVNPMPKTGVEIYIDTYAAIAKEEMLLYDIPASITLAQGILESGAGKGQLVQKGNNHFGIKCHGWKGKKVYHDDDAKGECFRKYKLAKFSYRDHSLFLTGRSRYASLFELPKDDYKNWAKGLRRAGYATDKKYPQKLISIIERYELYKYDEEVLGIGASDSKKATANRERHAVSKGETLYGIARQYGLTVAVLKSYNDLVEDVIYEGQILYLMPVNRRN